MSVKEKGQHIRSPLYGEEYRSVLLTDLLQLATFSSSSPNEISDHRGALAILLPPSLGFVQRLTPTNSGPKENSYLNFRFMVYY